MLISIITVNYRTEDRLKTLLASIETTEDCPECEWIVVNNSPEENLKNILDNFVENVRITIIDNPKNIGFGAGCNQGAVRASGEILLFLNPDCEFTGGSFNTIVQRIKDDRKIGAVGPRLIDREGNTEFSWDWFPGILSEYRMRRMKMRAQVKDVKQHLDATLYSEPLRVDWVTGGALFMRSSVFNQIGGFDDRYFLYFEDVDLCKRLGRAGYSVWFDPSFELIHDRGGASSKEISTVSQEYRRSQLLYYKKHRSALSQALLSIYLRLKAWTSLQNRE